MRNSSAGPTPVSHSVGNPLYHWCQLELLRYFGVEELLTAESAPRIWETYTACWRPGRASPLCYS